MKTRPVTDGLWTRYSGHIRLRTDGYVLLAALLTNAPSQELIELIGKLRWEDTLSAPLDEALNALHRAAILYTPDSIDQEFQRLFVGLGRGELVPYSSWYLEKMVQSAPLAAIRADLLRLGLVRQSTCFEPEDHAGILCEIMALLSVPENDITEQEQAAFFRCHIAPWMPQFFQDVQDAEKSQFYRTVGSFGQSFLAGENAYLQNFSAQKEMI